jgi:5-(carboxyamino)imidazole ribonucleotide mutase
MTAMPAGVPVAVVGLGHATNAAVLAVQILAVADPALRVQLTAFKDEFERSAGMA